MVLYQNEIVKTFATAIVMALTSLISLPCLAHGPFVKESTSMKELNLVKIKEMDQYYRNLAVNNFRAFVPNNFQASDTEESVTNKIIQHNLERVLESQAIKGSAIAGAAKRLNTSLDTEIALKSEGSEIQHKINVTIKAASTAASLRYSGLIDAQVDYRLDTRTTSVQLTKNVTENAMMVINHSETTWDSSDQISLRFSW